MFITFCVVDRYEEAIVVDGTNCTYYTNIAAVQMAQKDYNAARATCDKALEVSLRYILNICILIL